MKSKGNTPPFTKYMNPILQALFKMGGSGTTVEIYEAVAESMNLSEAVLAIPHGRGGRSEVQYRIAWALTYLKKAGLITNSKRGVWSLINPKQLEKVDPKIIIKKVRGVDTETDQEEQQQKDLFSDGWKTDSLSIIQKISPDAFERLCQRLLRESGFIEVTVTGKSGDGGIDGHGILRLAGLVSFRVLFQSKRYQGAISASQLRDFRGAMVGRADRGLFITTGNFTKDAQKEATRDGAPMIDLVDGDQLVEKLREYKLGIETKMIEEVTVLKEWFDAI
jgi:restriction system protein